MWTLTDTHSITPLLNSLFLEWKDYTLDLPFITVNHQQDIIRIELKRFSKIGHHQYTGNIYLNERKLTFNEFIQCLTELLPINDKSSFINRVQQSKDCIEVALNFNGQHFKSIKPTFEHTETALFLGHSLHPTPKSRSEFKKEDLFRYSPEHGGKFQVSWFKVHKSIYYEEHSKCFEDVMWAEEISDFKYDNDFYLLPIHPWQKENILNLSVIKKYLEQNLIIDLGEDHRYWTPTSSLRTIYNNDAKYMIKFSLDLKMTNSVRHLLVHELKRGIQIHEVSKHPYLEGFFKECPQLQIIQEPCFAGILNEKKEPIIQTLIMIRENPFNSSDEVSLLATLTQPETNEAKGLLSKLIIQSELSPQLWFEKFLKEAIAPFLILQGKYGVLLGAHQQNLILKLKNGCPIGAYFRDCHGAGFDAKKIDPIRGEVTSITSDNGNVLEQEVSHYLFAYYLIINSVFNMVSAISHQTLVDEEALLEIYKNFLIDLKLRSDLDTSFIDYLLYSPELKHKGNFFCTAKNINENTSRNPLDIYTSINNPLREFINA
ncbi:MAG TPA: IucA/IucC family protein [Bacteriovoracaceae bacterium]|nr:IucA/IucC family protein [Bacteriovoracaceae bacterium]